MGSLLTTLRPNITGAAPFSPIDIPGLTLWLDAADTLSITESGGAVSQWDDKSGNGYDVVQATAAAQPTTGTRTINSLNVLDFDGSTDKLVASTAGDWAFLHDGTTYLIGAVLSADVTGFNLVAFATQSGSSQPGFYYGHVSGKRHIVQNAIDNAIEADSTGAYLLTLVSDPDNATAADRSKGYINNGTVEANNTLATTATSPNGVPLTIGARNATLFWNGVIAELIIITGASATEANRQVIRDYLNSKWGVY